MAAKARAASETFFFDGSMGDLQQFEMAPDRDSTGSREWMLPAAYRARRRWDMRGAATGLDANRRAWFH